MPRTNSTCFRGLRWIATLSIVAAVGLGSYALANKAPLKPPAKEAATLNSLMKDRVATLQKCADATESAYQVNAATLEQVLDVNRELADAELQLATTRPERIAVFEKRVANAMRLEAKVQVLFNAGAKGGEEENYLRVKADRLEAQIALTRERQQNAA